MRRGFAFCVLTFLLAIESLHGQNPVPSQQSSSMPSLQDEQNTYKSWNWTWTPAVEPAAVIETIPNFSVIDPDIHHDSEGDDLWTYSMMYRRTGLPFYLNRATAWARYFKNDYRTCVGDPDRNFCYDKNNHEMDHLYGWGLVAWYESTGDTAALTEAENIGALVENYWSHRSNNNWPTPGQYKMAYYGGRQAGRHLILASHLARVTGKQRWIDLRNRLLDLWIQSPDWDTRGMYFAGDSTAEAVVGSGAYAAGARITTPFQAGVLVEALYQSYLGTGRTDVRDRLVAMARFVDQYGMHPTYQYSSSWFGFVNGQIWYNYAAGGGTPTFWDPHYTGAFINLLVLGYKFTGDIKFYNSAKNFFNRATKSVYGSPTQRAVADNVVQHFVDTRFNATEGNFYLDFLRGELQYSYLIFENGGFPTVAGSLPPPDTTAPVVTITSPTNNSNVSSTITIAVTASDNVGVIGVQFKLDGNNLGSEDTSAPYSVSWNTTTATNGAHSLTAVARDA